MIGKTILHYKILSKLGEGGMGVVYKAEDTKIKREVAIKFLPRQIAASDEERERFKIEAQAAGALNHSNIATIHAIEEADDETFIVMEYIKGQELKDKIDAGPLPIDDTLHIAIQIARGLQAAHEAGVVHRDIKSSNIMLTERGEVKIMDFGLAKRGGQTKLTKEGTTLGTVAYMSPEQTKGDEVDQRSDIFSLGVLLHEMLSGQLPFKGDYDQAITYSILNEEPEPVTGLRTGVPMELERIVGKCLKKDPGVRYQHADELIADLSELKKDSEKKKILSQSGVTTVQRETRKPAYIVPAMIGLVIVIAILGYWKLGSEPANIIDNSVSMNLKSIAVLPFENMSEEGSDYFSDGITEDIITQLSKIDNMKVISRTSSMYYKNHNKKLQEIGSELGVSTVLEGSVRRAGGRVRITAQLIDVNTDNHVWAESYDRDLNDILTIQIDVAQQIANALRIKLSSEEKRQIEKKSTTSSEAYNSYLLGRFHWNKRTGEGIERAIEYFDQAINEDSSYALAYAGKADCYTVLPFYSNWPTSDAYPKAIDAVSKALALDPSLAEAYTSLGGIRHYFEWDWTKADKDFQQAISLKPGYATAHQWYGNFLGRTLGMMNEGLAELRQALELDPLSVVINRNYGQLLYFAGRYEDSIRQLRNTLAIDSTNTAAFHILGEVYARTGNHKEAIKTFKYGGLLTEGYVYAIQGQRIKALEILAKIKEKPNKEQPRHMALAKFYSYLGERDSAFEELEMAYDERSVYLPYGIYVDPSFDALRSDARFGELLKKMGLGN